MQIADAVGLEGGLRICISNKFLGDIDAAGLGWGAQFENHLDETSSLTK